MLSKRRVGHFFVPLTFLPCLDAIENSSKEVDCKISSALGSLCPCKLNSPVPPATTRSRKYNGIQGFKAPVRLELSSVASEIIKGKSLSSVACSDIAFMATEMEDVEAVTVFVRNYII